MQCAYLICDHKKAHCSLNVIVRLVSLGQAKSRTVVNNREINWLCAGSFVLYPPCKPKHMTTLFSLPLYLTQLKIIKHEKFCWWSGHHQTNGLLGLCRQLIIYQVKTGCFFARGTDCSLSIIEVKSLECLGESCILTIEMPDSRAWLCL